MFFALGNSLTFVRKGPLKYSSETTSEAYLEKCPSPMFSANELFIMDALCSEVLILCRW